MHFAYRCLYFRLGSKKVTMKNKAKLKGKPLQEKPEENPLENEIEDLIARQKTKYRIVGKLLNQTNSKKTENLTIK